MKSATINYSLMGHGPNTPFAIYFQFWIDHYYIIYILRNSYISLLVQGPVPVRAGLHVLVVLPNLASLS